MNTLRNKKIISVVIITSLLIALICPMSISNKPFVIDIPIKNKTTVLSQNILYKNFLNNCIQEKEKNLAIKNAVAKKELLAANNKKVSLSRGGNTGVFMGNFKLTAYNLSVEDCEKEPSSSDFGIASSGYDFKGKDLKVRKIAVDPKVIPMGSTVYLEFPKEYNSIILLNGSKFNLNGFYQAVDVGGAIKGNKIDLYVGGLTEHIKDLCSDIGVRRVKVYR